MGLWCLMMRMRSFVPAILWNDGRTTKETDYLNTVIGKETLSKYTANIAFAGFTAPKILWMKENEPELFAKINKIMLRRLIWHTNYLEHFVRIIQMLPACYC